MNDGVIAFKAPRLFDRLRGADDHQGMMMLNFVESVAGSIRSANFDQLRDIERHYLEMVESRLEASEVWAAQAARSDDKLLTQNSREMFAFAMLYFEAACLARKRWDFEQRMFVI